MKRSFRIPPPPRVGLAVALAAAVLAILVAFAIELALRPYIYTAPFIVFFVAVVAATWVGGFAVGLVTVGVSAAVAHSWFIAPQGWSGADPGSFIPTGFFIVVASLLALITWALRNGYEERAELAAASLRGERRFRTLVDASAQMIWTTAPDGGVVEDSPTWRRFTGQSLETFRGWGWLDALHPEDRERAARTCREAIAAERAYELEYRVRRADGSYMYMLAHGAPVLGSDGRVLEWVAESSDISERKRAEQMQIEALHARDVFVSVASHELKTPLAAAQLQIQNVQRQLRREPAESVAHLADRVGATAASVERLGALVNALLDVSHIASGKLVTQRERLDLSELVASATRGLAETAQKRGSELVLDVEPGLEIDGDRLRLEQVVTNLVANAIKYGEGKPISVALRRDGGRAQLSVADQGIGIAPDDQVRIFERFERAVSARNYGGLGLGLWIVRQILDACGGSLAVASEPGKGSTFTVSLPLRDEAAASAVRPGAYARS
ncbi:MAG TPA: ATP-binding protein [Anaeromyxobacteraceae bacterium]